MFQSWNPFHKGPQVFLKSKDFPEKNIAEKNLPLEPPRNLQATPQGLPTTTWCKRIPRNEAIISSAIQAPEMDGWLKEPRFSFR